MGDFNKKINNSLFVPSVTGSTLEEFAQTALLLPVKERTPPPAVTNLEGFTHSSPPTALIPPGIPPGVHQQEGQGYFYQQPNFENLNTSQHSATSVQFPPLYHGNLQSTFEGVNPVPLTHLTGTDSSISDAPSIPLFSSNVPIHTGPPQQSGCVNTYRRSDRKKLTYAAVPGLTTPRTSTQPILPQPGPVTPFQNDSFPPETLFSPSEINQCRIDDLKPSLFGNSQSTAVMSALTAGEIPEATFETTSSVTSGIPGSNVLTSSQIYRPVYHHWFYKKKLEGKIFWQHFSMVDSLALEEAFTSTDADAGKTVATDGGRFDVNILRRQRIPVYWEGEPTEVRRCSWFYKGNSDGKYTPYDENIATKLEEEYKIAFESNQWHKRVELPDKDVITLHSSDVFALFSSSQSPDNWNNTQTQVRTKIVKRGMDEFDIDEGEPTKVDHLLFLVHGIGSVCDLKFRTVEEVVDEFRSISLQLIQSHYRSSCESGKIGRVEVLPISWHHELHSEDTGIDKKLKSITLESIPRLRDFTNDTLLDILFYTSPKYCQTIISSVGDQLNKVFELFHIRNPNFNGAVSVGGHSLGALILFDLLAHQRTKNGHDVIKEDEATGVSEGTITTSPLKRQLNRRISYMMGVAGSSQAKIHYPHLNFHPKSFFALGSPVGMFITVRGLDNLGVDFALPTCEGFFNIFHPYDPVAYRMEYLINPELGKLKPFLIPHHKGRKRMHLELKETMARVGADLKQRVVDSMKNTWNSFYQLAMFHRQDTSLEEEVDKVFQEQLHEKADDHLNSDSFEETNKNLGILNRSRRIDYVLQESPFEIFNEYLFALSSHVCYWESEDTMLLILKEIYSSIDISADDQIPQQSMSVERLPSSQFSHLESFEVQGSSIGMNSTQPIHSKTLSPPPVAGFVKKS